MIVLILTVGTGTSGKFSNLASGLRRTIELLAPNQFWLVPSIDPESLKIAELVREGFPSFQNWSEEQPYLCISQPDSLEDCRNTVRSVIKRARETLPRKSRLIVNPTSGTKQMSVGAALAALDEGIGEIVFTVGERADGVVKTGTERLETFDASAYFAERDLAIARTLAKAGSHAAAATLLARHDCLSNYEAIAHCLREWERQNYSKALEFVIKKEELQPFRQPLEELCKAAKEPVPPPVIVADLLHTADLLHRRREFNESLILSIRALEFGLRRAFFEETGLREPYNLSKICELRITEKIKNRLRENSNDGKTSVLNLRTVMDILQQLQNKLGAASVEDSHLQTLIRIRNEMMHSLRAVSESEAQSAHQRTKNLLSTHLGLPDPFPRPQL